MNYKLPRVCSLLLLSAASYPLSAQKIEQITVTASLNERALLELNSNLSVINEEQLQLIEHEHVHQAIVRVPGGWISRGNGQEHLTAIRSPVLTGTGGCGAFFMAQDGISLRAPGFCNTNQLFDANTEQAQRIEVLRGPSSTLYGSNAVHGAINVITPNAFQDERNSLGVSMGPHDYYSSRFSTQSDWGEHALLMYGNGAHDGGYKDDSGFDQQKFNLIHQYQSQSLMIKNVLATTNLNQETAGFIQGFEAYKDESLKKSNPNPEAFRDSQSFRAYSQVQYQADSDTFYTITPYVRWADMTFLQHYLPWQPIEKNDQKSIGVNVAIEQQLEDVTWYTGVDIDFTHGSLTETQFTDFSPTKPAGKHYDYDVDAFVISPNVRLNWAVTAELSFNAGLRYEITNFEYQNNLSAGSACGEGVEGCRFTRPEDQDVGYDEFSYQIGGHYLLSEQHSVYGQFSTGYRAPQANELFRLQQGQAVADLNAEKLDSIEFGVRGQWQELFYDATLFTMQKDNFIFQDTERQNISSGKTSHHGVELSVHYQLSSHFYLTGNGTIANHKYDNSLMLSRVAIKGNEIDTAPQHIGSAQLGWQGIGHTNIELEWTHVGNYYLNPENTAQYQGHNLLNLRVQATIGENWTINTKVLNLTDEDYAERADFGFGNYRYFVGEPRSFYVSVKYDFGR
ncbi:TonB-dependent receptor [Thalassotalea atypica]|uniref:TonB-dependent receptor n=1 Tax=Thalassotalea atypica TaxID=2054316 RepID=UPI0025748382|nr:TonB-dependent receptor [Thalassotalea atypica]